MAGVDEEFEGRTWKDPTATVGYLAQEPELDEDLTVRENIEQGLANLRALLDEYDAVNERFAEEMTDEEMDKLIIKQGELQDKIDASNAWEIDRMVDVAMEALRVPTRIPAVTHLSGGERRRVALCRLLLAKPDLLLLDKATNHRNADCVAWLDRHLAEYHGTVILITHDRYFLDNVAKWILELDQGRGIPWEGNYSSWLEQKQKRMAQQEKQNSTRAKVLQKELEWVQMGQKARQAKSKSALKTI